jgi:hypothetical protein
MGNALIRTLGVSILAALAVIIASDLPLIGAIINFPGLNWVIWIGLWAWLADRFVKEARPALARSDSPSIPARGAGALLGVTSGLGGQLIQVVIQIVFMSAAASHAQQTGSVAASTAAAGSALSAFGSLVAIFVYPAFGAFWGGLFGLIWGMRVRQPAAGSVSPPMPAGPNKLSCEPMRISTSTRICRTARGRLADSAGFPLAGCPTLFECGYQAPRNATASA